jgi:hypothetical protein
VIVSDRAAHDRDRPLAADADAARAASAVIRNCSQRLLQPLAQLVAHRSSRCSDPIPLTPRGRARTFDGWLAGHHRAAPGAGGVSFGLRHREVAEWMVAAIGLESNGR